MFIAKLQKSLASSDGKSKVLIYNESKTVEAEIDNAPHINELFGNKMKVYAKCSVKPNGVLEIGNLVKDQKW